MIERIFKSWKSTAVGSVIIIASLTAVFMDKATLMEGIVAMGAGLALFFVNEKKKEGVK